MAEACKCRIASLAIWQLYTIWQVRFPENIFPCCFVFFCSAFISVIACFLSFRTKLVLICKYRLLALIFSCHTAITRVAADRWCVFLSEFLTKLFKLYSLNFKKLNLNEVDYNAIIVQLNLGILLGVMGTDVPLSDFLDTIPEHKVSVT